MKKYAQKNIKAISSFMHFCCRTPPGVRGLKSETGVSTQSNDKSHPTRGAWIEIKIGFVFEIVFPRRTPPGVRGLKYIFLRRPQGRR